MMSFSLVSQSENCIYFLSVYIMQFTFEIQFNIVFICYMKMYE